MEDRQKAIENKFAHDADLMFKAEARACKRFGLWVAEQLGYEGGEAETYARQVVEANLDEPGFNDVKRKVTADLSGTSVDLSDHAMDVKLEELFAKAKTELFEETEQKTA